MLAAYQAATTKTVTMDSLERKERKEEEEEGAAANFAWRPRRLLLLLLFDDADEEEEEEEKVERGLAKNAKTELTPRTGDSGGCGRGGGRNDDGEGFS